MYNKLKGKIIEKFGSLSAFSEYINVSNVTVSKKMNGKSQFSKNDIIKWSNALEIAQEEMYSYFFG